MRLIDKQKYEDWKAKNQDPYGVAIFAFVERWAELMEPRIDAGEDISVFAKTLSHEADTEGITGYMYGAAVSILSLCWVHGEMLRRWHNLNTQIRNEGEIANEKGGVLNPASLRVG